MNKIYTYITSIFYLTSVSCSDCLNLKLSISQSVENEGFHRDINWLIESNKNSKIWKDSACKIALRLDVPPGIFVNPDQISDLVRKDKISAYIDGNVNVETPAHESTGHTVYIFVTHYDKNKIFVNLPIHLRYQRAVITGGFAKVNLPKPSLLVVCPQSKVKFCVDYPQVKAPCDTNHRDECNYSNVTYQMLFNEVQLFVPVGDLDDYPLVSVVTLLLGCAGSIYILSLLSSAPV